MNEAQAHVALEPFFVGAGARRRLYIHVHPTHRAPRAGLIFAPPFAEEMNKSRRMVAQTARAFAAEGVSVLLVDLAGTGDSACAFEQATWSNWRTDILQAHQWLSEKTKQPVGLWGLRLGALLALDAAADITKLWSLILWQPVVSGRTHLTQFLRLKLAAEAISGKATQSTQQWMEALTQGESVEIAGYMLAPELAQAMTNARLTPLKEVDAPTAWLEVSAQTPPALLPASVTALSEWHKQDRAVTTCAVNGPPFWQSTEIETCAALTAASLDFLNKTP